MMRIVFFDKIKETYEAIDNVTHMHIDYINNRKCWVLYTDLEIKFFRYSDYTFHRIDC